jgi:F like protein
MIALPLPSEIVEKAVPIKLVEIADKAAASFSRAVFTWLSSLQTVKLADLNRTNFTEFLTQRFTGAGLAHHENSVNDIFVRTMEQGAQFAIRGLSKMRVRKFDTVGVTMSFTMSNPQVALFIQQYGYGFISGITAAFAETLRTIFLNSVQQGLSPAQQARLIEPLIGLTARQAQAVINYRQMLEAGRLRDALNRTLRDGRYDRSLLARLTSGDPLGQAQIDRMVARYAERSLRFRAMSIARTETIRAANAGQMEAWRQAQSQGLLSSAAREHWLVASDERACKICIEIPRMNPEGVPIGGMFQSPIGLVRMPPDPHTMCRCALSL